MQGWVLRQKLVRRVMCLTGPLLTWAARTGRADLAARLVSLHRVRVQAAKSSPAVRVVVLFKVGCTEDVVAALGGDDRFELSGLDRRLVKAMARAFLPRELDDNNYCPGAPGFQPAKDRYREFLAAVWTRCRDRWGAHAVVTGNFGYCAEREVATALEQIGVPFVVLQKENLRPPGQAQQDEVRNATHRGPFGGRMILQYNEVERGIEVRSGVVTAARTRIVGMPRMDRVHRWREANAGRPWTGPRRVLFFLFGLKSGIPTLPRKGGTADRLPPEIERAAWREMQTACIRAIVDLARGAPDLEVVFKTKGNKTSKALLRSTFGSASDLPPNFRVVPGGDPLELLTGSTVVCGFNSTALLEALAAGKPVVVPRFAEAIRPEMQPYVVDMGTSVEYADSPGQLIERLQTLARSEPHVNRGAELTSEQQAVLDRWTGNPDGRAGERVRAAFLELDAGPGEEGR